MLAYTLWHWRRDSVGITDYETWQGAFHQALSLSPIAGFQSSSSLRVHGAPWANSGGDAYQDRYLLDGSAALDALELAAVSGACQAPHAAVAASTGGGQGGLYEARLGRPLVEPAYAHWFAKPAGVTYAELERRLGPLTADGHATLWSRRMVLGPTPEFCLETGAGIAVPAELRPLTLRVERVWPPRTPDHA